MKTVKLTLAAACCGAIVGAAGAYFWLQFSKPPREQPQTYRAPSSPTPANESAGNDLSAATFEPSPTDVEQPVSRKLGARSTSKLTRAAIDVERYWEQLVQGQINEASQTAINDLSVELAEYIAGNSARLTQVGDALLSSTDTAQRDLLMETSHLLPLAEKRLLIERLLASYRGGDRSDAVTLLESLDHDAGYAQKVLTQLLFSESDPQVIQEAVNAAEHLNHEQDLSTLTPALEHHLKNSDDLSTQVSALNTLLDTVGVSDLTTQTVVRFLDSDDQDKRYAGVAGLATTLSKLDQDTVESLRPELLPTLELIANNGNADPSLRIMSLSIIRDHFSEKNY